MTDEVGRVTFETNIAQVRDEIVTGLAGISAALEAEMSKSGGNPASMAESQVAGQLAKLRDAARQEIEQIKREFAAEQTRSTTSGTPFINPSSSGFTGNASEQIRQVLEQTSRVMLETLTEFPETIRSATGDFRSLAQREVTTMLQELERVFVGVNQELQRLLPAAAVGSPRSDVAENAQRSLSQPIAYASDTRITNQEELQATLAERRRAQMERDVAATEARIAAEDALTQVTREETAAGERLAITTAEAARRVEASIASGDGLYSRVSKATSAPFKITDPDITQPGQSPFFRIVPPTPASKDEAGDPGGLERITALEKRQQLEREVLTTLTEQENAIKAQAKAEQDHVRMLEQAHSMNEKFDTDRDAAQQKYLGMLERAYAMNEQFNQQQKELTLGQTLSAQRVAGTANPLGNNLFQMEDGSFVKRNGEAARELTAVGELADAELQLSEKLRRRQLAEDKRRAEIEDKPQGVLQGFAGGFTSRGFDSNGSNNQTLSQDITNLSATAGVLAKYSLAGEGIKLASEAMSTLREETISYTEHVETLNLVLEGLNEQTDGAAEATVNLAEAQQAGLSVGLDFNSSIVAGTTAIAAYQQEIRNGADANDVFNESIRQTGINVLLTGQKADVAQKQLIAATQAYGTGSAGQSQVNDAIQNAFKNFGGDRAQISQAVGAAAPLASQGGISEEELANMASLINVNSTQTGSQIATTIERLVSRSQNKQFITALQSNGIADTGNVAQELEQLSAAYQHMDRPAQQALETQLGSSRALTGLLPLIRHGVELTDANAKSLEGAGVAQDAANKHLATFGGQLASLGATLKTLAVDVGTSGIFAPIGLALELVAPPLRVVTAGIEAFDHALSPLGRNIGGLVVDLGLAALAWRRFQAGSLEATATGLAAAQANNAQAVAARAATAAEEALADSMAAQAAVDRAVIAEADALLIARTQMVDQLDALVLSTEAAAAVGRAEVQAAEAQTVALEAQALAAATAADAMDALAGAQVAAGASGGKNVLVGGAGALRAGRPAEESAGLGGPALLAIAVVGVAMIGLAEKGYHLRESLNDASDAIEKVKHGTAEDLQASISRLSVARANVNKDSSGFFGTVANAVNGDPASAKRKELTDQIKELEDQAVAVREASVSIGSTKSTAVFGATGPATVDDLTQGIQRLKDAGQGANKVMATLITVIDGITGASQRAVDKVAPGSLVLPTGDVGLQQSVLGDLKDFKPKISLAEANDLVAATYNKPDVLKQAGLNHFQDEFDKIPSDADPLDTQVSLGGINPSAEQQKAIRAAITKTLDGLGKNKAGAILTPADQQLVAHAAAEALNLPEQLKQFQPIFEAEFLSELKKEAKKPLTSANIRKDPTIVTSAVGDAIAAASQRTSEASARGADSTEMLNVQQQNLKDLTHIADSVKSAGLNVKDFDNLFQGLKVARKELFDAFAQKVKDTATAAEKGLGNSDADQARKKAIDAEVAAILTTANKSDATLLSGSFTTLSGAQNIVTNAALVTANNAKNAANALIAQAEADAQALEEEADALDKAAAAAFAMGDFSVAANAGRVAGDQRNEAKRVRGKAASTPAPKVELNDPAAQAGINNSAAAANSPDKAATTDTAAQIAAARYAAGIFPGDKVGEAAAALKTASANLAAEKKNTVAYYNALGALHKAEEDYANAVLAAQDTARLLGIDRTNPLLVAQDRVRAAQAKLAHDQHAGADRNTINTDRIAVQDAQNDAESVAFNQRFHDAQIADQLGRTSHQAYLNYLNNEHDRLTAIHHRTRQQQDELDQVDQALQAAAQQMQGQWNIGDIKVPTIYEVRRSMAARAGGTEYDGGTPGAASTTNHNQFTFTGLSKNEVLQVIQDALGAMASQRYATTSRKV